MSEPAPGGPNQNNLQGGASGKAPTINSRPFLIEEASTVSRATSDAGVEIDGVPLRWRTKSARPKQRKKQQRMAIMPDPTKLTTVVDQLVNQYHQINRRYESVAKDEKTLGQRVTYLTDEEMAEYVERTTRRPRPYPQVA